MASTSFSYEPMTTVDLRRLPGIDGIINIDNGAYFEGIEQLVEYMKLADDTQPYNTAVAILEVCGYEMFLKVFIGLLEDNSRILPTANYLSEKRFEPHFFKLDEYFLRIFRPRKFTNEDDSETWRNSHRVVFELFPEIAAKYPDVMAMFGP